MNNFKILLKGFWAGFKSFGYLLGEVVNFILLTLVYFVGVGITSVIAKIFNRHFLALKKPKKPSTYWVDLNLTKEPKENYYRQF